MDLAGALAQGGALLDELDDGDALERRARQLLAVACREASCMIVAASPPAERLVGAALALGGGAVRGWTSGADPTVLVCDVMLASGESLIRVATRLRRQGAERVVALVFSDPFGWGRARVPGVDALVVIEHEVQHGSEARQALSLVS